jgi:hypothetical protein
MQETNNVSPEPVSMRILDQMEKEGICMECLSSGDIVDLFRLQAKRDDSGDKPILKNSAFTFFPDKICFAFNYSIAGKNEKKDRSDLKFTGTIINGSNGVLSEDEKVLIEPQGNKIHKRVYESFGTGNSLPVKVFFKSMIEDALRPNIEITEMKLVRNKLSLITKSKTR